MKKIGLLTTLLIGSLLLTGCFEKDLPLEQELVLGEEQYLEEWTNTLKDNPWDWTSKDDVYNKEWLKTIDTGLGVSPYGNFSSRNRGNLIYFESTSEEGTISRYAIYDRENHKWLFDCFDGGGGGYIEADKSIDIDTIDVMSCKEKYDETVDYLENQSIEEMKSNGEQPQRINDYPENTEEVNVLAITEEPMNIRYVINLKIGDKIWDVTLEDNTATKALLEELKEGDIVVHAQDYGNFEKVGYLGFKLPTEDSNITTEVGDLVLYNGNQVSLFYDSNSWSYTRLGKVQNITKSDLGDGDVILTFSLLK